mmetsp:Transcript_29596/g.36711  ORF Transcript_29596/g.36711 Transcript_29596/m.36711 type:complete len:157 (+) Transcript_29596:466-936(+)
MRCAIKVIPKLNLNTKRRQELNRNEFEIVEEISHPHIVRVFELMEDSENFYIMMELMQGGDLLHKLIADDKPFTEAKAASVISQILLALNFMHARNIMHRDLKLENILCEDFSDLSTDEIHIKLADFGLATKFDPDEMRTDGCGTTQYYAPEICRN